MCEADVREGVEAATVKRDKTAARKSPRKSSAAKRKSAVAAREEAVKPRKGLDRLPDEVIRAREQAARVKSELEEVMLQVREVNERLVVATVKAQTMTEEAEKANRLKDEFLATVSHELRTPLNAVLGWARMLKSKQLDEERTAHAIETVERNASALANIIDDLLDVSRIVAGTLHVVHYPVDLAGITQAAVDAVKPIAAAKSIRLQFLRDPSSTEVVSGDAGRLEQVVTNLLTNAIKFTPENGRVDVSIKRTGPNLRLVVEDTGEGISPDFLPHVFDRFRQADGAASRRHTGLGLGLAIVRQILELHEGTVRADSAGPGKGATFTVCLPILTSPPARAELRSLADEGRPAPSLEPLDGLHVLVVEDNADGREIITLMLEQAGARVTGAASAKEASEALESVRPDVLVSDIGLPDEDGYALVRRLRSKEAERGGFLPAVAMTGFVRAEDRARVLAAGFQVHVPKPIDVTELTAAIAAVARDPRRRGSPAAPAR
jgi:signal transduction histidine kinase/ActR/RegA family two-component response regulator